MKMKWNHDRQGCSSINSPIQSDLGALIVCHDRLDTRVDAGVGDHISMRIADAIY